MDHRTPFFHVIITNTCSGKCLCTFRITFATTLSLIDQLLYSQTFSRRREERRRTVVGQTGARSRPRLLRPVPGRGLRRHLPLSCSQGPGASFPLLPPPCPPHSGAISPAVSPATRGGSQDTSPHSHTEHYLSHSRLLCRPINLDFVTQPAGNSVFQESL